MKRKITFMGFFLLMTLGWSLILAGQEYGIPNAFQISPSRSSSYALIKVVYNPQIDKYVVLYKEHTQSDNVIIYSRVFSSKGKPAGPAQEIISGPHMKISGYTDAAYNEKENKILMVWADGKVDQLNGWLLDGEGKKLTPSNSVDLGKTEVVIKKASGYYKNALFPRVFWVPGKNIYVITWGTDFQYVGAEPTHPENGLYFASLKSNLNRAVRPKMVRHQTTYNVYPYVRSLIPLADKLLLGTADDSLKWSKPMVLFIDFKGNIVSSSSMDAAGDVIYPGRKSKGRGWVNADYNPLSDVFLLTWTKTNDPDTRKQTYRDIYYRMMDSSGKFKSRAKRISGTTSFQTYSQVRYNSVEDRFFLVYAEYQTLYEPGSMLSSPDKSKWYYGGRLWGQYINNKGKTQGKKVPLTSAFKNENWEFYFAGLTYNSFGNEFFIVYEIWNNSTWNSIIWGIIYK